MFILSPEQLNKPQGSKIQNDLEKKHFKVLNGTMTAYTLGAKVKVF